MKGMIEPTKEELEEMIDREYPIHGSNDDLDIYGVVESVLCSPSKCDTYPNADWTQRNWVEFYGPDQQWHITMVTRIDERESQEEGVIPFVEAVILRNTKMLDIEIEKLRCEVKLNREKLKEKANDVMKMQNVINKMKAGGGQEEEREEEMMLSDYVGRERSLTSQKEKNAKLENLADIRKIEYLYDCGYHYKLIEPKFLRCPEEVSAN